MKKIVAIFIAFIFIWMAGEFLLYNKRIMDVCDTAKGKGFSDVSNRALNLGLKITDISENGTAIIHSTKNFGRGVCFLEVHFGVVQSAFYDLE